MTNIASVSQSELAQRRKMLRRHRRIKLLRAVWQTLTASSLLGGLAWAIIQPIWIIRESNQIIIEGNQLLSEQQIQSLLPLHYPQSLLQIEPEAIALSLESQPPIADATVTRQLFPPGITVQVQERVPVAIALTKLRKLTSTPTPKTSITLLDSTGVTIPVQSYGSGDRILELPKLKVIGSPDQYRHYWTELYQAVSQSPIKITEINCQDPANLILKTELGIVHLGSYTSRLAEQLKVLDQMRKLPTQINSAQIAYIDLKNPQAPLVQMNQTK